VLLSFVEPEFENSMKIPNQKNHMNSIHVLASDVIKKQLSTCIFDCPNANHQVVFTNWNLLNFVKILAPKNKKKFEIGLVQPGPYTTEK